MRKSLLLALLLMFSTWISSQELILEGPQAKEVMDAAVLVRMDERNVLPKYIDFGNGLEIYAEAFISQLKKELKLSDQTDFRLINVERRGEGEKHYKYIQTFQGKDVEFSRLHIHMKVGRIVSVNMEIINDFSVVGEAGISAEEAFTAALQHVNAETYKWEMPEEEAFLKRTEGESASFYPTAVLVVLPTNARMHSEDLKLAYRFDIYAHKPMSRADVYMDAITSELLFINNKILHADSKGTAVTAYSGTQDLTTDSISSSSFRLRSGDRGNGINTYDMNQGTSYGNAVDFTDSDNYWNNVNSQQDEVASDAHWGAQVTYDYFYNKFNRNSINDQGFALNNYVHYDAGYSNAFWDGNRMTYGDGSSWINPFTTLDITAHEISHGLTDFTADLVYRMESGALNESFSDIFAAAIERYGRPNNNNWNLGEDIGVTLRSMSNPNLYGDPDTREGSGWVSQNCFPASTNDYCGVHTNSSVQNFWFYLLVTGGSGTNDLGHSYSVNGIGMDKAAAIAYRNLSVYLTPTSDYDDARFYSIASAKDLFGTCSPELAATVKAWYAVGIGPNYVQGVHADFFADFSSSCTAPHTVNFTNQSSNGISYEWNFGDGSAIDTNINPSHVYTQVGQYDVTLIVNGDTCGSDTLVKQSFVLVDTNLTCAIVLKSGSNPVQTDCEGKFYDTGGAVNNYNSNELSTLRISPVNASSVSLSFTVFDVENGTSGTTCDYDYFEVYDGPNANFPLLGRYCNNNPPPTNLSSSTGDIFIVFSSDPGLELKGFEVDWQCSYASASPQAEFANNLDSSCTGEIQFFDRSLNGPTQFQWDFGDGNTSTKRNPKYRYQQNGDFNVTLKVSNSFGSDSISKSKLVSINAPNLPLVTEDSICVGDTAKLSASGSGWMRWYASMDDSIPLADGPVFTAGNFQSDTTFYVENWEEGANYTLGASNINIGGGSYFTGDKHLIFDVYQALIIESVDIYANTTKARTIQLRNSQGLVLQSKTFTVGSGSHSISLNFEVEAGTNYQLGFPAGSQPNLYGNSYGASFPYTQSGLMSLKSSSAGNSYYYFFYNWKVKELDCLSPRTEAKIYVDPNCGATSINERSKEAFLNVYPNPSKNVFNIELKDFEGSLNELALYSAAGNKVKDILTNVKLQENVKSSLDVSDLPAGIYFLRLRTSETEINRKLIIVR